MPDNLQLAAVGLACLDFLAVARQAPVGGTGRMERLAVQGGGLTATAAVAMARLGGEVTLLTRVGDDEFGSRVLDELRAEKIRLHGSPVVAGAQTPCSVVMVDPDTAERTIYHFAGRGLERSAAPEVDFVGSAQALVVDAFWPEAARAAAETARAARIPVVADFAPGAEVEDLAGLVDVFIVPESWAGECADDCSRALDRLHAQGAGIAVITAGPRGCWYSAAGERGHCPAFEVPVVDTTGAGDVFHGAFAYALARGWEVARGVEFASAVAALKCGRLGGRAGIPDLPRALEFLRARGRLDWSRAAL